MSAKHVVVVGYGMAGARLAEEVRRRDPDADRVELTVLGAEPHLAYNRVLLSSVVAGSVGPDSVRMHGPDWADRHRVDVRLRTPVRGLDRGSKVVRLAGGRSTRYDAVVLATGSRPYIPPTPGLTAGPGTLAEGVHEFRTVDDCERIIAAAGAGVPVAVLGGGLLGLEAAWALAGRGNPVTVVHRAQRLMDRQLDPAAAAVLARVLAEAGVKLRLGRTALRYEPGQGLRLDDGRLVPAGLVLVCAGVRAETGLAERAGLPVRRGIAIDDRLRTADPRVYAIGDCAEHSGTVAGQVQPAWDQAAVLADLLTGADEEARYEGTLAVTRLKARGLELAAMGEVHAEPADGLREPEVLWLQDPGSGRYAKVVLRGDRLTGAIVLGMPDAAAQATQHFDQGIPAPADRFGLLLGAAGRGGGSDPAALPDDALICRCNTVTKGQLAAALDAGASSVPELAEATRATTGCGSCRNAVSGLCEALAGDR